MVFRNLLEILQSAALPLAFGLLVLCDLAHSEAEGRLFEDKAVVVLEFAPDDSWRTVSSDHGL